MLKESYVNGEAILMTSRLRQTDIIVYDSQFTKNSVSRPENPNFVA